MKSLSPNPWYLATSNKSQVYATSALAGVCFTHNTVGGMFPLFETQIYENLGYGWTGPLLEILTLVDAYYFILK
jgi:hypothetical protein